MRGRRRTDGSVAAALLVIDSSFAPQWANPMWDLFGFDISAESRSTVLKFREIIEGFEPIEEHRLAIDEESLRTEFDVQSPGLLAAGPRALVRAVGALAAVLLLAAVAAAAALRRYAPERWVQLVRPGLHGAAAVASATATATRWAWRSPCA